MSGTSNLSADPIRHQLRLSASPGALGNEAALENPTKEGKHPSFASDEVPSSQEQNGTLETVTFPEGGLQAWLAIMGGFLTLFASFGIINAYVSIVLSWNEHVVLMVEINCGVGRFSRVLFNNTSNEYFEFCDIVNRVITIVYSVWPFSYHRKNF